jgi:hypothetical protein
MYRFALILLAACGSSNHSDTSKVANSQPAPTTRSCGDKATLWVDLPETWEAAKDLQNVMNPNWRVFEDHIGPESVAAIRARIAGDVRGYVAVFQREVLDAPLSAHALAVWRASNVADEIASVSETLGARLRTDTLLLLEHAKSCVTDPADGVALDVQIREARDRWAMARP